MIVIPVFLVELVKKKDYLVSINRFVVVFFTGKAHIPQVNTLINVKLSLPCVP